MNKKNKKYLSFTMILVMALSVGVFYANAEDSNGTPEATTTSYTPSVKEKREAIKTEREAVRNEIESKKNELATKREEVKNKIEAIRETSKTKMEQMREALKLEKDKVKAKIKEDRINNREQALKRFDNAIETISKNKERTNAHIVKVKALGVDTTSAETTLATVDLKLTEAKSKVAEMNTLLSTSVNEINKEQKDKLRTLTKETQTLIKDAHNSIKNAVKSLKDAIKAKGLNGKIKEIEKIEDTSKVDTTKIQ